MGMNATVLHDHKLVMHLQGNTQQVVSTGRRSILSPSEALDIPSHEGFRSAE